MKYLHDDALAELTALLTDCPVHNNVRSNSRRVYGRLEAYTMKRAGSDKKYAVQLGQRFNEQEQQKCDDMMAAATAAAVASSTHQQRKRSMSTGEAYYSFDNRSKKTKNDPRGEITNHHHAMEAAARGEVAPEKHKVMPQRRGRSISLDIQRTTGSRCDDPAASLASNSSIASTAATNANANNNTIVTRSIPNFKALSQAAAREREEPTLGVNRKVLTDLILTLNHSFPDYDFATATANDFTVSTLQTAVTRINERLSEVAASNASGLTADANSLMGSTISSNVTTSNRSSSSSSSSSSGHLNYHTSLLSKLWTAVDRVITLSQVSAVYSYQPADENGQDDALSFLKASLSNQRNGQESCSDVDFDLVRLDHPHRHDGRAMALYSDEDGTDEDNTNGAPFDSEAAVGQVLWTFNYFFVNKQTKRILLFTCVETILRSSYATSEGALETVTPAGVSTIERTDRSNDSIPEHDIVRRNDAALLSPLQATRHHQFRRSPSLASSATDDSDNETTASSAVSVDDFDLDPANAVSGGIPIGRA